MFFNSSFLIRPCSFIHNFTQLGRLLIIKTKDAVDSLWSEDQTKL